MSAIATGINNKIQDWASFFRVGTSFIKRKNPMMNMVVDFLNSVQGFIMAKQRLKNLKNRVQIMHYRIYSMEQVIQQNNPYNFKGGKNLNHLR